MFMCIFSHDFAIQRTDFRALDLSLNTT
jgi:hypothetical protein